MTRFIYVITLVISIPIFTYFVLYTVWYLRGFYGPSGSRWEQSDRIVEGRPEVRMFKNELGIENDLVLRNHSVMKELGSDVDPFLGWEGPDYDRTFLIYEVCGGFLSGIVDRNETVLNGGELIYVPQHVSQASPSFATNIQLDVLIAMGSLKRNVEGVMPRWVKGDIWEKQRLLGWFASGVLIRARELNCFYWIPIPSRDRSGNVGRLDARSVNASVYPQVEAPLF